ncbi:MAG: ATP-binding protein [Rikenellaceae bacterium]
MNFIEDKNREYKSLRKVIGKQAKLSEIAEGCVAFANAQGGIFIVGIEDKESEPPKDQTIDIEEMNKAISRLRSLTDSVGITNCDVITHANGGEYFTFRVMPSTRTIAVTSSGKVFMRLEDNSVPITGEDLTTLAAEKSAFQWELVSTKITIDVADKEAIGKFISDIKSSPKVSDFIKEKDEIEILKFYQLVDDYNSLTNLGVLWLGTPSQRARISYPITVQYIVYNANGEKIRKESWHFHQFTPKELLTDIKNKAIELTYSTEVASGLFRKLYPNYPEEAVRELLLNAVAHKKYTISGDIFIEVFSDKLVITNPGGLPFGVTSNNILHARERRNPHLIQTLHDTDLMEGEGSGYDKVYDELAKQAKHMPIVESDINKVSVTLSSTIVNEEALAILNYVENQYSLTRKESITFGLIATEQKISATELSKKLQLDSHDKARSWIGTLITKGIIITRGVKKGVDYMINPEMLSASKLNIKPTLKTIEPHRLEALVYEDVKLNGASSVTEISSRIPEVERDEIQKVVYKLRKKGDFDITGAYRDRKYLVSKKK